MAQYIDKDALVGEIEKYISNYKEILNKIDKSSNEWVDSTLMLESKIDVLQHILSFLNTLEVKEIGVDLGDPKGDKSAKYIIDTKTLEVKEVEESVNEDLEKVANYKFDDIEEKWRDIIDTYPDADVFIEKTWEWLKEIVAYYTENESTFEDFRKYIKGE